MAIEETPLQRIKSRLFKDLRRIAAETEENREFMEPLLDAGLDVSEALLINNEIQGKANLILDSWEGESMLSRKTGT